MLIETSGEIPLAQLNCDIEQLEANASRQEAEMAATARDARRVMRWYRYLQFVRWLRAPAATLHLWRITVLLTGPAAIGLLSLISLHLLTASYPVALLAMLVGTLAGAALFAAFMYHPGDTLLPATFADAEAQSRLIHARLEDRLGRISDTKHRLQARRDERRALIESGKAQRAALLERNWKAMRGIEWEEYLLEVCRAIGVEAERTGKCGDQGCDLIVQFGQLRIAVQAKGYHHVVGNKAVQEAVGSVAHYRCDASAVITNSRFTRAARDLAESNRCVLIGEDEFPNFVMGRIALWLQS